MFYMSSCLPNKLYTRVCTLKIKLNNIMYNIERFKVDMLSNVEETLGLNAVTEKLYKYSELKMDDKVENLQLEIQVQSESEDTPHVSKAPKTKFFSA